MTKPVLTFGVLSGLLSATLMLATMPFAFEIDSNLAALVGYAGMVLCGLLIFFGVRSYREKVGSGRITFWRGLAVGTLITLVSACFYVATWETLYFGFVPDLGDRVAASMVAHERAKGASDREIVEAAKRAQSFKKLYDNPAVNVALTFLEPLPVGLAIAAISAAVLRQPRRREAS
jgi:hypothetical protein